MIARTRERRTSVNIFFTHHGFPWRAGAAAVTILRVDRRNGSRFPAPTRLTLHTPPLRMSLFMRKLTSFSIVVLAIAIGLGFWYWNAQAGPRSAFKTVPLERGPFLAAISATGTVEPMDAIDVGAQVAGRVQSFGIDPRTQEVWDRLAPVDALTRCMVGGPLLGSIPPVKVINYGSPVEP